MYKLISFEVLFFLVTLLFSANGCNQGKRADHNLAIKVLSQTLKEYYQYWIQNGISNSIPITEYAGTPDYFVYTNTIDADGTQYQCRFGAWNRSLPSGVLTITDEGVILWIRNSDGLVTVSPEKKGID